MTDPKPPPRLLRFSDFVARGIMRNREHLRVLIAKHGFPRGFLISPQCRVWDEPAVEEWLQSRREASAQSGEESVG